MNGSHRNSEDISLTSRRGRGHACRLQLRQNKYDEESYYLLLPEDCYAFDKTVYTIPGLGRYLVQSVQNRDYFIIMGTTIFLATLVGHHEPGG